MTTPGPPLSPLPETVSVVIPFYNGSLFVEEALAAIRAQTHPVHEIIVVDDASRPEEAAALDRAAAGCMVIHLPKNRGPSVARNVGIGRASGTWIAFLDCDDLWAPTKLAAQFAYLRAHPACRAVHTSMRAVNVQGEESIAQKEEVHFEDLVRFPCPIFPSSIVMHRDSLIESGLFDPTKRCCEDLDLFLRFSFEYPIAVVPQPLMIRRVQKDGLSRNLAVFWREADRVYREYRSVFSDERAAGQTLQELHADFVMSAIYQRDFKLLGTMARRAVRRDVSVVGLTSRVLRGLVKNRLGRGRVS